MSVLTGISRAQHGYYYFRQLRPGSYDIEPRVAADLGLQPFWARLRGSGARVLVIDAPDCLPVRGLEGLQLLDWASHNNWDSERFCPVAEPEALLLEIQSRFGARLVTVERPSNAPAQDVNLLADLLARVARKGELCRALLSRGPFDLVVAVFGESHAAGHQFWNYRDGSSSPVPGAPSLLRDALLRVYEAIDRELGSFVGLLPSEANVVVVSSVGLQDAYPTPGLIDAFLRRLGYQPRPEASRLSLRPLALARRALPERFRIALSRGFQRATRERLLADQFRHGTDWPRATAFSVPASYTSFLRINLAGREPSGAVRPAEYDGVLDALTADLRALEDAATGEGVVAEVVRTSSVFGGGPHEWLPDLFVDWKPGRFWQAVRHPKALLEQRRPEFYRVSDHSNHGLVLAAGPKVAGRGDLGEIPVLDLAPTFLALLGLRPDAAMRGRANGALLDVVRAASADS